MPISTATFAFCLKPRRPAPIKFRRRLPLLTGTATLLHACNHITLVAYGVAILRLPTWRICGNWYTRRESNPVDQFRKLNARCASGCMVHAVGLEPTYPKGTVLQTAAALHLGRTHMITSRCATKPPRRQCLIKPSTWGDRRDSNPLTQGSQPCPSTSLGSITVPNEGIEPSSTVCKTGTLPLS